MPAASFGWWEQLLGGGLWSLTTAAQLEQPLVTGKLNADVIAQFCQIGDTMEVAKRPVITVNVNKAAKLVRHTS